MTLRYDELIRISNRLDDLIGELVPRDQYGVPLISRDQMYAIQTFNDWLDENFADGFEEDDHGEQAQADGGGARPPPI